MRRIIMQVLIQIVAFSLKTDGSGRPVLTKGNESALGLGKLIVIFISLSRELSSIQVQPSVLTEEKLDHSMLL